ncbi:hypothetical protein ON010_g13918 [Phytophthora cinnamomi]|nr:hypothetical protein ON010_g13918 [Phytophthora cinnamomi]
MLFIMLTGSPLTSNASRQNRAFGAFCEMGVAKVIDSWGLASNVSPATVALLDKLLNLEPSDRPTADELIELLGLEQESGVVDADSACEASKVEV